MLTVLIAVQTACLTETMFDQAQERARHLDSLQADGKLAGPLHGLPVSLKDGFQVAGVPATLGMLSFVDHVSDTNSPLVEILLELGAVLYVKTNIPQTLLVCNQVNDSRIAWLTEDRPQTLPITSMDACSTPGTLLCRLEGLAEAKEH